MTKSISVKPGSKSKVEVESTDLDIRDLAFATDKVDTSGSTSDATIVALDSSISSNSGAQLNITQYDSSGNELKVDTSTHNLVIIDQEHHEIHEGDHYVYGSYVTLGSAGVLNITLTTPDTATQCHMLYSLIVTNETLTQLYEGATVSAAGAALTPVNSNRNSTNTSSLSIRSGSTITTTGTVIMEQLLGSSINPNVFTGGITTRNEEIILKRNTKYLLRITSNTASNNISYRFTWYEHVPA